MFSHVKIKIVRCVSDVSENYRLTYVVAGAEQENNLSPTFTAGNRKWPLSWAEYSIRICFSANKSNVANRLRLFVIYRPIVLATGPLFNPLPLVIPVQDFLRHRIYYIPIHFATTFGTYNW